MTVFNVTILGESQDAVVFGTSLNERVTARVSHGVVVIALRCGWEIRVQVPHGLRT